MLSAVGGTVHVNTESRGGQRSSREQQAGGRRQQAGGGVVEAAGRGGVVEGREQEAEREWWREAHMARALGSGSCCGCSAPEHH